MGNSTSSSMGDVTIVKGMLGSSLGQGTSWQLSARIWALGPPFMIPVIKDDT